VCVGHILPLRILGKSASINLNSPYILQRTFVNIQSNAVCWVGVNVPVVHGGIFTSWELAKSLWNVQTSQKLVWRAVLRESLKVQDSRLMLINALLGGVEDFIIYKIESNSAI